LQEQHSFNTYNKKDIWTQLKNIDLKYNLKSTDPDLQKVSKLLQETTKAFQLDVLNAIISSKKSMRKSVLI
jgi:hypothetical protein